MRFLLMVCCTILLCTNVAWATNPSLSNHWDMQKDNSHVGKNLSFNPRQGGDTIFDATVIPGLPYSDAGTTAGYNNDYDEVCPYSGSTSPDVVYEYTAPVSMAVDIDLCGSSYDTKVYVYDGGLDLVACNDDFYFDEICGVYVSMLENIPLSGGATYYIVIDGYGGDFGDYLLDIIAYEPCVVDCPPGAVAEGEPPLVDDYEDAWNGGCNSPQFGNPFQELWGQGNETVQLCGVSGWYTYSGNNFRDTDWFVVYVGESGVIDINIDAEQPVYLYELGPQYCDQVGVLQQTTAGPCLPQTMYIFGASFSPVWIWVGPTVYSPPGGSGNEFDYVMTISGIMDGDVPSGTIVIDPDPDLLNAPWYLEGPGGYSDNGTGDAALTDMAVGEYTLTWGGIEGWSTPVPNPVSQSLTEGETITFSGTYTQMPEGDFIGLYSDMGGANCFIDDIVPGLVAVYVVHSSPDGSWGSQFSAPIPPVTGMVWLGDSSVFPLFGNSQIGVEVPYGTPQFGQIHVLTINYFGQTLSPPCTPYPVLPDPGEPSGEIIVLDINQIPQIAAGGVAMINGNGDDCPCNAQLPTGTVVINPDPDSLNAPWHLAGPEGYDNSGAGDVTLVDMPIGGYTLTWGEVAGWVTPEPNPVVQILDIGATITFSGTYLELGTVAINPEPDDLNAPWHLENPEGYGFGGLGDAMLTEMVPGSYTLIWLDVAGWTTPSPNPQVQDLPPGGLITFDGIYIPIYGWSDGAGGSLADPGAGAGVAWGDCDPDGSHFVDLYLVNEGDENRMFHNESGGVFTDITADPLGHPGHGTGAYWGDYDNDGDPDLYLLNAGEPNALFRNLGECSFADATTGVLGDANNAWGGAWVDYDNDGFIDLYISNEGQANLLLKNNNGLFSDQTPEALGYDGNSQGAAWGDYDNDGDQDLYLAVGAEPNKLFENLGDGQFADVTTGPLGDPGSGQGAAWGDYDNDEDLDLYVTNWGGPNLLLRNDGGGNFTDVTTPLIEDRGWSQSAVWADYDNDGHLDLYLANYGQPNRLFLNDGQGGFVDDTNPIVGDPGNSVGAAWADMEKDGDLDLYVANFGSPNRLFVNNVENDNHWLHIKLVGTLSNSSAIGARVKIVTDGMSQIREVNGGSGYLSQNSLMVEFGLGSSTMVESVLVIWPRKLGQGQYHTTLLADVAADQILEIIESDDAFTGVDDMASVPWTFALHQCYPNPFNPMTTIKFQLPRPTQVTLHVYDMTGRLVRRLRDGDLEDAGTHEVIWSGKNDRGELVSSGTYLYRLGAGEFVETKRMVLIK